MMLTIVAVEGSTDGQFQEILSWTGAVVPREGEILSSIYGRFRVMEVEWDVSVLGNYKVMLVCFKLPWRRSDVTSVRPR